MPRSFHLSRAVQRRLMTPIIIAYFGSIYTYTYLISSYCASMGASLSMIGMATGAYGLMQVIFRIPFGVFSDRIENRKKFFILGLGGCLLAALGLYFAKTPFWVMVFNGVSGIAVSNWAIFISSYCSYFPAENTTRAVGFMTVLMSIGQLVGTVSGGLAAQAFGIRYAFLAAGVLALLGLLIVLLTDDTYTPGPTKQKLSDFVKVITSDRILLFYAIMTAVLSFMNLAAISSFVPVILKNLGASSIQITIGSTLSLIAGLIVSPLSCTLFKDKLGIRKTAALGFIIIGLPMFFFARVRSIPVIYLLEFIAGMGHKVVFPLFTAMSTAHLDQSLRSTGLSTFQAIYAIGMFGGPALSGVLSDLFTLRHTFTILGVVCALVVIYVIFTRRVWEDEHTKETVSAE